MHSRAPRPSRRDLPVGTRGLPARRLPIRVALVALFAATAGLTGCGGPAWNMKIGQAPAQPVLPDELAEGATGTEAPSVDPEPEIVTDSETATGPAGSVSETTRRVIGPDGTDETQVDFREELPVGVSYPIDGLVGQINGRPVYADDFLVPLEDRILRIVAEIPEPDSRFEIRRLVTARFREYVDSELIIAEAESNLSPEMQQGVFAWLQNLQEETITNRGGTRETATTSIEEEFGLSIEEFMAQRRSLALASDLLQKRVKPRAIVSWRDVEQAYRLNEVEYNPPPEILIGRIRLHRERKAEEFATAQAAFEAGQTFEQVVQTLGLPDRGQWLDLELPPDGISGTSLASPVKSRLENIDVGQASESLEQGSYTSWFTILEIKRPKGRSIYDPEVQLSLENELSGIRFAKEQNRYLTSLRDQWVADAIENMRVRLIKIAEARYLDR